MIKYEIKLDIELKRSNDKFYTLIYQNILNIYNNKIIKFNNLNIFFI